MNCGTVLVIPHEHVHQVPLEQGNQAGGAQLALWDDHGNLGAILLEELLQAQLATPEGLPSGLGSEEVHPVHGRETCAGSQGSVGYRVGKVSQEPLIAQADQPVQDQGVMGPVGVCPHLVPQEVQKLLASQCAYTICMLYVMQLPCNVPCIGTCTKHKTELQMLKHT